jgi:hypothetical protein
VAGEAGAADLTFATLVPRNGLANVKSKAAPEKIMMLASLWF